MKITFTNLRSIEPIPHHIACVHSPLILHLVELLGDISYEIRYTFLFAAVKGLSRQYPVCSVVLVFIEIHHNKHRAQRGRVVNGDCIKRWGVVHHNIKVEFGLHGAERTGDRCVSAAKQRFTWLELTASLSCVGIFAACIDLFIRELVRVDRDQA